LFVSWRLTGDKCLAIYAAACQILLSVNSSKKISGVIKKFIKSESLVEKKRAKGFGKGCTVQMMQLNFDKWTMTMFCRENFYYVNLAL
jgi:hypothetical protein